MIKIANAPCSWGALEFDLEEKSEEIGFEQVLDEIKETGYIGTELGDWGYMPTVSSQFTMRYIKEDWSCWELLYLWLWLILQNMRMVFRQL